MNLIIFELKKIFKSRLLIMALVLFTVIDVYKIFQQFQEYGRDKSLFNQQYYSYYKKLRGTMTPENIQFVVYNYNRYKSVIDSGNYSDKYEPENTLTGYEYSDMNLFREFYEQMDYAYNYGDNIVPIIERAETEKNFFEKKNNLYEMRKNLNIVRIYSERKISDFYDVSDIYTYINYDFSSLLLIIILILGLSGIYSNECQCGMDVILKTTILGRKKQVYAKLTAALIFTVFVGLFIYTVDFIEYILLFRLDGFGNPLYSINDLKYTPFNGSILEFIILNTISKVLGLIVISLIITLVSCFSYDQLISITVSSVVIALFLCVNIIDFGKAGDIIGLINPINMLSIRDSVKKFSTENIFNYPVQRVYIISALNFFTATVLFISIVCKNRTCKKLRNQVI